MILLQLIKNILTNIYKVIFSILGAILPKNNNLIIFESFLGKQFSDNPRAIYEYLKKNHPNYILIWSFNKDYIDTVNNRELLHVKRFSLKWLFLMTRAKYWVSNSRLPLWIPKPKKTIYLQTWHGTPLKKLGKDIKKVYMSGENTTQYKKDFILESSKWDYLVSPNKYSTKIFKRAFEFNQKIIETGYPRNDFLINNNNTSTINVLKSKLNIPQNKKIILYAPTWRDDDFHTKGKYSFKLPFDLDSLYKEFKDDYLIILRLHYLVAENIDLSEYDNFILDYSYHEDIRDLYIISDILITDYSSVFFDYAILKRPMIFYVHDIENYRDNLRGFYFDFENNSPGPLVKTTNELISAIHDTTKSNYPLAEYQKDFYDFILLEDGCATERVVNEVFDIR